MTASVVAVVAARNEEDVVARTVKALASIPSVGEVVVMADGCRDRTADEAAGAGARVLVAPARMGKGAALDAAIARTPHADAYLLVDADVGDTADEAALLLEPVLSGRLDLAIGRLPPQAGGGFGLVKRFARGAIRLVTGWEPVEPLSGQRAATRMVLDACRPLAAGFGVETAMTIDAVRLGFRVGEEDVGMTHRPTGRSFAGFVHRARQGWDIVRAVAPRWSAMR